MSILRYTYQQIKRYLLIVIVMNIFTLKVFAAPPFMTDDASPADVGMLQSYIFSNINVADHVTFVQLPAVELDYGVIPNLELHLLVPLLGYFPKVGGNTIGLGDTEVGIKYRFINEGTYCPAVAFVPALELPTGDADRQLGNGKIWTILPVWLQKNWGPWTTYGGGGYAINKAANMRNYFFGGWFLQRQVTKKLALGGEIYSQGDLSSDTSVPPFQDNGAVTLLNLGGTYALNQHWFLLFSAGHSVLGVNQWVGYLGLNCNLNL